MAHVPSNIDRSRSPIFIPFAILGVLTILAASVAGIAFRHEGGAGAGGSGDAVPSVSNLGPTTFVNPGPFGVGETTLHLTSNGAPVEIWYPASPDAYHGQLDRYNVASYLPASILKLVPKGVSATYLSGGIRNVTVASGRFPLVLFSHGFAGFRTQSTFLTSHLASWGFIVAAPEHRDRDLTAVLNNFLSGKSFGSGHSNDVADLESTIALMGTEDQNSASSFYRHLDMGRIGAVGHSAGGAAVEKLAVVDSQVKVFVGLAGASYGSFGQTSTGSGSVVPKVPGLLEYGTKDGVVKPAGMVAAYNALHQPKRLISILGAGHLVFSDICQLAPGQGGLIALANKIHLPVPAKLRPLGSDGCLAPDLNVTAAWPLIRQSVTAQLRWAMGFDQSQAGLEGLESTFAGIVGTNTTADSVTYRPGA